MKHHGFYRINCPSPEFPSPFPLTQNIFFTVYVLAFDSYGISMGVWGAGEPFGTETRTRSLVLRTWKDAGHWTQVSRKHCGCCWASLPRGIAGATWAGTGSHGKEPVPSLPAPAFNLPPAPTMSFTLREPAGKAEIMV